MCGIFTFAGPGDPDPELLQLASTQAARRGPHAHGWVTHDEHGPAASHHALGPVAGCGCDGFLTESAGPRVLGHSRLATMGRPDDIAGTQPLVTGRIADRWDSTEPTKPVHTLAHNGNAYNAAQLDARLAQTSDTAVLLDLYRRHRDTGATPTQALGQVADEAEQNAWALVVLDDDGTLVSHRHELPLYRYQHSTGVYLSSVAFADAVLTAPDRVHVEAPSRGRAKEQAR